MKRRLIRASLLALMVLVGGALLGTVTSGPLLVVYNPSPSMPVGWYLRVPLAPAVGRIVVIDPPMGAIAAGWPGDVRLIKPVVGAAGDRVCADGSTLAINGLVVTTLLTGGWYGCRRLGPDELFLLAPQRADSVDSRVYGPVRRRDVIGVFTPIWTKGNS